jgi:3-deoxy-D-manno-octulosonate 8-phosphate phosphatase (KDO 8-P phosphatase)
MDANEQSDIIAKLSAIKLFAMDVDGVLTDGGIIMFPASGENGILETKQFSAADGLGLQLVMIAGIHVAWITGRKSLVVEHRAKELGVEHLYQACGNKASALTELMAKYSLLPENIAYMGDDLNDFPAFEVAGVHFAPANAAKEVKALAHFITENKGGEGAVREVCDTILKLRHLWSDAFTQYLGESLRPSAD